MANTSETRPCNCGQHCPTCGAHRDPRRAIGWDGRYCSPRCDKIVKQKAADAFAAWWNRPRAQVQS